MFLYFFSSSAEKSFSYWDTSMNMMMFISMSIICTFWKMKV